MTVNNTESLGANSFNETRSVFYCTKSPQYIWDLNHTTSLKIMLAVTTITCPITILLNLLVIIAVKTRRELKKNSNILLSSLAVTDLLVGAVSMPLTVTFNALLLQRILFEDVICTIRNIGVFVMYTVYFASFLHLLLIAWERYVAIVKWMKYKIIVTRDRVKKYVRGAWLFTLITIPPLIILETVGVRHKLILAAEVIMCIFWVACLLAILYFYVKVYLGVRKQNRTQVGSVNALAKAKLEKKIAYTTFWITLLVCISGVPSILFGLFYAIWPFFREGSIIQWAQTMLQLNSLFNPLLYCYRNRRLRKAALELLRCRKPQRIQAAARTVRRNRRRRYSVASLDVEELQIGKIRPRVIRAESCGAVICSETFWRESNDTIKERPVSAPSKLANDKVFTQQPKKIFVTVQIENAPRKKRIQRNTELPKQTTELERSRPRMDGKITRSASLNESSCFTRRDYHKNSAEKNFSRIRSLPTLSTTLNTLENKLTDTELTSEKEPALNSYQDTKL